MRFGCALDLWHKGQLHLDEDETPPKRPERPAAKVVGMPEEAVVDWLSAIETAGADELQAIASTAMEKAQEHKDREAWLRFRAAAKKREAK